MVCGAWKIIRYKGDYISLPRISLSGIIFWLDGPFYVSLIRNNIRYCVSPPEASCVFIGPGFECGETPTLYQKFDLCIPRNETVRSRIRVRRLPHCTENPIYVFPDMKLRSLVPNSYNNVSVSDLFIPRIGLPHWLQKNKQTDSGNIPQSNELTRGPPELVQHFGS